MIEVQAKRTILKTLTWRVAAAVLTFLTVFLLSKASVAAASLAFFVMLSDLLLKTTSYYFHEYLWSFTHYGLKIKETKGVTVWFSGLPCSGKTTIARKVKEKLEKKLHLVEHLDGDVVRQSICSDLGFSKKDRDENIWRITLLSSYLSMRSVTLCTFVSPYKKARQTAKTMNKDFVLVFVDCPVEECIKRDVKGMYAKALKGEIKSFTGIDDPYESPESPDLVCKTLEETVEESADKVINVLKERGYI